MQLPLTQENLVSIQNAAQQNSKEIVQSFSKHIQQCFLEKMRMSQFEGVIEVIPLRNISSMSMPLWSRKAIDPLQDDELELFLIHKEAIEEELFKMLPTVTFEYCLQKSIREYITTEDRPHQKFTWNPELL